MPLETRARSNPKPSHDRSAKTKRRTSSASWPFATAPNHGGLETELERLEMKFDHIIELELD